MSGCLAESAMKNSKRVISHCLPAKIACTHKHAQLLHRTVLYMHLWLSSITNAAFSYSFTPSLYHSLSSSALPLFFVSLSPWSPLKHVSLLQAFFFMWSFQLFLLHSNAIFGKQLPVLRSRERNRGERETGYTVQCSTWRTWEQVRLVCLEMALKLLLIYNFCGAVRLWCTPQWTAHDGPQEWLISDSSLSRLSTKPWGFGWRFSYVFLVNRDVGETLKVTYKPLRWWWGQTRTNLFQVLIPPPSSELGHWYENQ